MIICGRIRRATVREDIDHALQRAEIAASLRLARAEEHLAAADQLRKDGDLDLAEYEYGLCEQLSEIEGDLALGMVVL